ncbi:hypothetical protein Xmau_02395 [Xenorhabdus mauleonii]|uniref:Uncharacterized protein n=1 Tax=Xenorhabdus mauleonii TaxID=351675 RepID=A0A1I3R848_9GAMM|nr:DUF6687 family protein [Xenorhabdus mauleonii]PHM39795.1 hypothetical protein Xmau_02395 [Xenorhabdus mauleonii]SFJ42793.1 hypothetical protein SAMN05421680_10930 [Xenorhabdus mauleonii]
MINTLPLHDGDDLVLVDNDVAAKLDGLELRLLANRVIAFHHNQFFDLQNIIAGRGAITRNGNPYDLRRQNLAVQHYNFGRHGELELHEPKTDSARFAVLTPTAGAAVLPTIHEVRLSPGDRLAFLPFEKTRNLPNIAADAIHNKGTQLSLSHWPSNRTPERYKANLSTESVMKFLMSENPDYPADARYVTTDHFDLDGLASVYALLAPEHAMKHKQLLIDVGQFDDFARGHNPQARRLAFTLNTIAAQTPPPAGSTPHSTGHIAAVFAKLLPAMRELLDASVIQEELWRDTEQNYLATEALLDNPNVMLEQYPELDLAVFRLPASEVPYEPEPRRYLGFSPIPFHNRTPLSTIALVTQDDIVVHQRYEGWVELQSGAPRPRRDLSIFMRALESAEPNGCPWYYDGVQYIMPRFGRGSSQPTHLPIETILDELKHFLAVAPPAWLSSPLIASY